MRLLGLSQGNNHRGTSYQDRSSQTFLSMFYVVSAQQSASVSHSLSLNFTSDTDVNLIVAKSNKLELYLLQNTLELLMEIPVFGRIVTLDQLIVNNKVSVVFTTTRNKICVLSWDHELGNVVTDAYGDISDKGARAVECGQILCVHQDAMGVYMSQGLFKILPISHKSNGNYKAKDQSSRSINAKTKLKFGEAFNTR